jgi:hypothetical protein
VSDILSRIGYALDRLGMHRGDEMPPPETPASMVVQVYSQGNIPTSTGQFFACHPCRVLGTEAEGSTGTGADHFGGIITVDTSTTVHVYFVGSKAPQAGEYHVARFVRHRWVAERMTHTTALPSNCFVQVGLQVINHVANFGINMTSNGTVLSISGPDTNQSVTVGTRGVTNPHLFPVTQAGLYTLTCTPPNPLNDVRPGGTVGYTVIPGSQSVQVNLTAASFTNQGSFLLFNWQFALVQFTLETSGGTPINGQSATLDLDGSAIGTGTTGGILAGAPQGTIIFLIPSTLAASSSSGGTAFYNRLTVGGAGGDSVVYQRTSTTPSSGYIDEYRQP